MASSSRIAGCRKDVFGFRFGFGINFLGLQERTLLGGVQSRDCRQQVQKVFQGGDIRFIIHAVARDSLGCQPRLFSCPLEKSLNFLGLVIL